MSSAENFGASIYQMALHIVCRRAHFLMFVFKLAMNSVDFDLTLVRHGRTDANRRGVIQGHVDTPLDCQGIVQVVFYIY